MSVCWFSIVVFLSVAAPDDVPVAIDAASMDWKAPEIVLSSDDFPADVDSETALQKWVSDERENIVSNASELNDNRRKAWQMAAAANWILSREIEPVLSRWLHNVAVADDVARATALVAEAKKLLEAATSLLPTDSSDDDSLARIDNELIRHLEMLGAFSDAFDALVADSSNAFSADEITDSARALIEYLESPDIAMSSSASLWQAALYSRAGRIDRAIRLLRVAASPPKDKSLHPDYFARLLRCRLIARRGGHAAAWSMLSMLEERTRDWFLTMRQRAESARAATLIKFEVCDLWVQSATENEKEDTRAWCTRELARIQGEIFPTGGISSVIRLNNAIPLVVTAENFPKAVPEEDAESGDTETDDATKDTDSE